MKLVPLLACDLGLGFLPLERDLRASDRRARSLHPELIVTGIDHEQRFAGVEETTDDHRRADLHDSPRDLGHYLDRDLGHDLAMALDDHRDIAHRDDLGLDQRARRDMLDPRRRLARGGEKPGGDQPGEKNDYGENDLEESGGHRGTSAKFEF
ncbi:MAG: hypothetical protein P8Y93_08110 [Acidobacteriota bacterium]